MNRLNYLKALVVCQLSHTATYPRGTDSVIVDTLPMDDIHAGVNIGTIGTLSEEVMRKLEAQAREEQNALGRRHNGHRKPWWQKGRY